MAAIGQTRVLGSEGILTRSMVRPHRSSSSAAAPLPARDRPQLTTACDNPFLATILTASRVFWQLKLVHWYLAPRSSQSALLGHHPLSQLSGGLVNRVVIPQFRVGTHVEPGFGSAPVALKGGATPPEPEGLQRVFLNQLHHYDNEVADYFGEVAGGTLTATRASKMDTLV